ncbi:MAG: hypothetical protein R3C14_40520 [Caldilineaceae bacterium]
MSILISTTRKPGAAADETVSVRISAPTISEARELLFRAAAALVALDCQPFAQPAQVPLGRGPTPNLAAVLDEIAAKLAPDLETIAAQLSPVPQETDAAHAQACDAPTLQETDAAQPAAQQHAQACDAHAQDSNAHAQDSDAPKANPFTGEVIDDEPPRRGPTGRETQAEFNTTGAKLFGRREWPQACPWLVGAWTRKYTPANQRTNPADLDPEEISAIMVGLVGHPDQTLAEYRKHKVANAPQHPQGTPRPPSPRSTTQPPAPPATGSPRGQARRSNGDPAAVGNVVMAPARNAAATG